MDLTAVLNPEPSKLSAPVSSDGEPLPDETVEAEPFIYIKEVDESKDTRKETERYACYVKGCDNNKGKYFTRPRSVLEHLQKFHNAVPWDRSKCARYEKDSSDPTRYNLKVSTRGQHIRSTANQQAETQPAAVEMDNYTAPDALPDAIPDPDPDAVPDSEPPVLQDDAAQAPIPTGNEVSSSTPPVTTKPTKKGATKKGGSKSSKKSGATKKTKNSTAVKDETPATPTMPSISGTPVPARAPSGLAKKQPSLSIASSPTVQEQFEDNMSGSATDYEEGGTDDEGAVYCICRKGDNHTWMVSCDGGCDEWFHGDCVGIPAANHDVIDKFICPNCEKEGKGRTTYKPHCSFMYCYRAAKYPSKYCSDACGKERIAWALSLSDPVWAYENNRYHYCINAGNRPLPKPYLKRNGLMQHPVDLSLSNTATKELLVGSGKANGVETPSDDERDTPLSPPASDDGELSEEEDLPTRGGALKAGEVKILFDYAGTDVKRFKELGNQPRERTLAQRVAAMKLKPDENAVFDRRLEFLEKVRARAVALGVCGYDKRLAMSMAAFAEALENGGLDLDNGESPCQVDKKKMCRRHLNWMMVAKNDVKFERELARKGTESF